MKQDDRYWALDVSPDSDYQIHLKRNERSCFVNNYNPILLIVWSSNNYKAATYIITYFSKSGHETSEVLLQAENQSSKK